MRDLITPKNFGYWDGLAALNRDTALCLWLAKWSAGAILDIGCGKGDRAMSFAIQYPDRTIVAVDWSQEHRIPEKQKRPKYPRREIGKDARQIDFAKDVRILDTDPATLAWDEFQPITFAVIDYDYSREGLKRVTPPLLEALPALATPNTILAWAGYQHQASEFNEVFRYVNSLSLGGTHFVKGSAIAFKVFNPSPEFTAEIKSLTLFD